MILVSVMCYMLMTAPQCNRAETKIILGHAPALDYPVQAQFPRWVAASSFEVEEDLGIYREMERYVQRYWENKRRVHENY